MKTRGLLGVGLMLVVAGCGGGGGDGNAATGDPYTNAVRGVVATAPDNTEPVSVEGFAVTQPDNTEPETL
jgi:hypothetical protein